MVSRFVAQATERSTAAGATTATASRASLWRRATRRRRNMRRWAIGRRIDTDFRFQPESLERLTHWLLRTQDPSGCLGLSRDAWRTSSQRVEQSQVGCSMLAAGLGSTLICADLLDAVPAGLEADAGWAADDMLLEDLPPALKAARAEADKNRPPPVKIRTSRINVSDILADDRARAGVDGQELRRRHRQLHALLPVCDRTLSEFLRAAGRHHRRRTQVVQRRL